MEGTDTGNEREVSAAHTAPPRRWGGHRREIATVSRRELSRCIADPMALDGEGRKPGARNVSSVEPGKGLNINVEALKRAREIYRRIL